MLIAAELTGNHVLDPKKEHHFFNLVIKSGANISVSECAILRIIVKNKILIESGAMINLTGKGYPGGKNRDYDIAQQGTSPTGNGQDSTKNNGGGGGGGRRSSSFGSVGGGGGGYGSPGSDAEPNRYNNGNNVGGKGGAVFGSEALDVLYLGAGGVQMQFVCPILQPTAVTIYFFLGGSGCRYSQGSGGNGGSGGGALLITTELLENHGTIISNGNPGEKGNQYGSGGGGGSGGSIFIKATVLHNKGKIITIGGEGGGCEINPHGHAGICSKGGQGGSGRIRIEYKKGEIGTCDPQPSIARIAT